MKAFRYSVVTHAAALIFALGYGAPIHATVTNVAWYRLGENDAGAASGVAVTNTTTDFVGGKQLKQYNGPLYTNAVAANAANGLGSSLAVHCNGANQYLSNAVVSTAINNFGIEAWVRPNTTNNSTGYLFYNGGNNAGYGVYQFGNNFFGHIQVSPGVFNTVGGSIGAAAPGTWIHVALVRSNGTSQLYLNGSSSGSATTTPGTPTAGMVIAGIATSPGSTLFNGMIDELRVFSFGAGQFSTNDLLFNAQRAVTLPATNIGPTNATLRGAAHACAFLTTAWFEWGTTTNYGNVTGVVAFASGSTNLSQTLTGLSGGFTYHFRAVASNALGVAVGTNQSFYTPPFTLAVTNLPGLSAAAVVWGDYDNDGRLDLLMTGRDTNAIPIAQVWRNTSGGFTNVTATVAPGLEGVYNGSVAWGDYDNDGRLDFLMTGAGATNARVTQLWRNSGSGFTDVTASVAPGLPAVAEGSANWGDFDNDGRLDFLLMGFSSGGNIAQLWRNTGSGFTNVTASFAPGLPGVRISSAAWGDYDNDGRLDLLITGLGTGLDIGQLWRNTGSGLVNVTAAVAPNLGGVDLSCVAWGDYDNDGRLDFVHSGGTLIYFQTTLFRNTGNGFTNITFLPSSIGGLPAMYNASVAWGDYDNDGLQDILIGGSTNISSDSYIVRVYRNTGNGFTNVNIPALSTGVNNGNVAWGDYDNDGRLDFLITGIPTNLFANPITQIWRNETPVVNTLPAAPTGLTVNVTGLVATLSWNAAADAQTPAGGMSYNVRIGTAPGASDVLGPMAAASGMRRLPEMGNAQAGQTATFDYTLGTGYYWSVQAVDSAFAGSPFAAEGSFRILSPAASVVQPQATNQPPGDTDGNGSVSQSELDSVLANYFPTSPWLYMTNVAGLGGTNVTFALSNSFAGAFSVEYTTNLLDWFFLGPATPRYLFTDTNAPAVPQRYYRLRWP